MVAVPNTNRGGTGKYQKEEQHSRVGGKKRADANCSDDCVQREWRGK